MTPSHSATAAGRMSEALPACGRHVRIVGGQLVSSTIAGTRDVRVEVLRRDASRRHRPWHFCQPETAVFWFAGGARRLQARVDGRPVDLEMAGGRQLMLLPQDTELSCGEWTSGPVVDYTVVFLRSSFVRERLGHLLTRPMFGLQQAGLVQGLAELVGEAPQDDPAFGLLAEGWAMQALARFARLDRGIAGDDGGAMPPACRFGARELRRLRDHVDAHIGRPITLDDLAGLFGLSRRHLLRSFRESLGTTPHRYVVGCRIEAAKRLLADTRHSITEVALAAGFSHSQHFANTFRAEVGMTPSAFRRTLG